MLKYLRIAVTALSATACVLLCVLWVRSRRSEDQFGWTITRRHYSTMGSVHIRDPAFDRLVPPSLDPLVKLLIQLADRARRDPRAPQRLGDVFHPPYAHAGQAMSGYGN